MDLVFDRFRDATDLFRFRFCHNEINRDLITKLYVVAMDKSELENVLSWSGWKFKIYRHIQLLILLHTLIVQSELRVDNCGTINQLELHILWPCKVS